MTVAIKAVISHARALSEHEPLGRGGPTRWLGNIGRLSLLYCDLFDCSFLAIRFVSVQNEEDNILERVRSNRIEAHILLPCVQQ